LKHHVNLERTFPFLIKEDELPSSYIELLEKEGIISERLVVPLIDDE
jgi:hypothetical protein